MPVEQRILHFGVVETGTFDLFVLGKVSSLACVRKQAISSFSAQRKSDLGFIWNCETPEKYIRLLYVILSFRFVLSYGLPNSRNQAQRHVAQIEQDYSLENAGFGTSKQVFLVDYRMFLRRSTILHPTHADKPRVNVSISQCCEAVRATLTRIVSAFFFCVLRQRTTVIS